MNNPVPEKIWSYIKNSYLALLLIAIGIAAYANSFNCPFIYRDKGAILRNPFIRHLWPLTRAMSSPAPSLTVAGRPLAALTLALNYAISGYSVWSYHLFNLIIHLLATFTLYGIVHHTLLCKRLKKKHGKRATPLAWTIAAIWLVHPIQTESVTYIVQRVESLMGLFYLLTLYTALRVMESRKSAGWSVCSVLCCALGMATNEVMVTAPLLVLLYDRAFGAGSFALAVRRRWAFYIGLAATWIILAGLMLSGTRSNIIGFSTSISVLDYTLSQFGVVVHYLRLCLWPSGLCLDYGWTVAKSLGRILPPMLVILPITAIALWGLVRNSSWSYPLVWIFLILAPTSSFLPIADLAFEHRMYLPLAGFAVLLVIGGHILLSQILSRYRLSLSMNNNRIGAVLVVILLFVLGLATINRNRDYRSELSMWQKVLDVVPNNPRGHTNLAFALQAADKLDAAVGHYNRALQLAPDNVYAHVSLGSALNLQGELDKAARCYLRALELAPDFSQAHYNLAVILQSQGKLEKAIYHYNKALEFRPHYAEAHNKLGNILSSQGKFDQAVTHYNQALQIHPGYADAHCNLANALKSQNKFDEAIEHYNQAIQLKPDFLQAHDSLAALFLLKGKVNEALSHYHKALKIQPDYFLSLNALAKLLAANPDPQVRDVDKAVEFAEQAAQITKYRNAFVLNTLAEVYAAANKFDNAIKAAQIALELARADNNKKLSDYISSQLKLYKQKKQ
jgi:tetratricopeptide (TPR) repeat protein